MRPKFWEKYPLKKLQPDEWEALCDGCGRCCLNKLEDPDTGDIALTRIACRLLDGETAQCGHYECRKQIVSDCIFLTVSNIEKHAHWLPKTCAYRLLWQGKSIPAWHPLLTGTTDSVKKAGVSVRGWSIPEFEVDEDDWENFIIEDQEQ